MENIQVYGGTIRSECLLPFAKGWEPPTPNEIKLILSKAGNLTGRDAGDLVGVTPRTVRRWIGEPDKPIPYACWAILVEKAGFGRIWGGTP